MLTASPHSEIVCHSPRAAGLRARAAFLTGLGSMILLAARLASGQMVGPEDAPSALSKTLGGMQFWADVHHLHGWRIQQNVVFGQHRLLDPNNYRYESGSFRECKDKLAALAKKYEWPKMTGKCVVLAHGIIRSSKSFANMIPQLRKAGYTVVPFDYPSTRKSISENAEYLKKLVSSLSNATEIDFVCHSMGGLVVRVLLDGMPQPDPRFKRLVMAGTPNNGAEIADMVRDWPAFKLVYGPAGQELISKENPLLDRLETPSMEFGIIAGGKQTNEGYNPLIPGDDDGVVSVVSTRLSGARDFHVVRSLHTPLLSNEDVISSVLRFLNTGAFRDNQPRRPIP